LFISDEAKGNKIIGEAATNLIFNREPITTANLIKQLKIMAEIEADEDRLLLMHETCRWLQGYISLSCRKPERAGWLDGTHTLANSPSSLIRLVSSQNLD